MKFSKNEFVNYQLVDKNLKIKNSSILSLFQDVVFDYAYKVNDGILNNDFRWFLISYHVQILDRPTIEDTITINTWSADMKGFIAKREFEVINNGKTVIKALTNLTRYNFKEKHLVRLNEEMYNRYSTDPSLSIYDEFQVEKVDVPKEFIYKEELFIPHSYIDANDHINNVNFYDLANQIMYDFLGTNFDCNEFIIHYKEQIKEKEKIVGLISEQIDSYIVIIKDKDEKIVKSIIKLFK